MRAGRISAPARSRPALPAPPIRASGSSCSARPGRSARCPPASRWSTRRSRSPSRPIRRTRCAPRPRPRSCRPPARWPTAGLRRSCRAARPARRWPPGCSTSAATEASTGPRWRCRCPIRAARRSCCSTSGPTSTCRPEHLVQFAHMGSAFAQAVIGIPSPRVALLSNGEEPGKGTPDLVSVHEQLAGARRRRPELRRQHRGHADRRGRGRRGGDGRLHRQHHAEADRGRLEPGHAAGHASRPPPTPAGRLGQPADRPHHAAAARDDRSRGARWRLHARAAPARRGRPRPLHRARLRPGDRGGRPRRRAGRDRPHARRALEDGGRARRPPPPQPSAPAATVSTP